MQRLLILNGAEGRLNVIIVREGCIEASHTVMAATQGAERLTPLLRDAFRQQAIEPDSLTHIACVTGPGSFTGLRLTLVTAAALRRTGKGALLYGINYLQAIATSLAALSEGTRVRVITHARRGLVYMQDFTTTNGAVTIASELGIHPLDAALSLPHSTGLTSNPDILVGSGVMRNEASIQEYFQTNKSSTRILPASCAYPSSKALFALCPLLDDPAWQASDLEPDYLGPCDAEDNLAHIATKDGRSPEQARQRLDELLHSKDFC